MGIARFLLAAGSTTKHHPGVTRAVQESSKVKKAVLTSWAHFQGSKLDICELGVGSRIHLITSWLFTIHTSGILRTSSRNRYNEAKAKIKHWNIHTHTSCMGLCDNYGVDEI